MSNLCHGSHRPFRPVAPLAAVLASSININGLGPGLERRLYAIKAPVKPDPMITMSTSSGKVSLFKSERGLARLHSLAYDL